MLALVDYVRFCLGGFALTGETLVLPSIKLLHVNPSMVVVSVRIVVMRLKSFPEP